MRRSESGWMSDPCCVGVALLCCRRTEISGDDVDDDYYLRRKERTLEGTDE
jgi:hypothetical protein